MADTTRVDLTGDLAGHHILLDPNGLTFGLLEDLQSGQFKPTLDALAEAIVGGDLPKGTDRAGLRRLKLGEGQALLLGVSSAFEIPKR